MLHSSFTSCPPVMWYCAVKVVTQFQRCSSVSSLTFLTHAVIVAFVVEPSVVRFALVLSQITTGTFNRRNTWRSPDIYNKDDLYEILKNRTKVVEVVISLKNVVLIVIAKALKTDALNRFSTVSGYFTLSYFSTSVFTLWFCGVVWLCSLIIQIKFDQIKTTRSWWNFLKITSHFSIKCSLAIKSQRGLQIYNPKDNMHCYKSFWRVSVKCENFSFKLFYKEELIDATFYDFWSSKKHSLVTSSSTSSWIISFFIYTNSFVIQSCIV